MRRLLKKDGHLNPYLVRARSPISLIAKVTDCAQWPRQRFKKTAETDAILENFRRLNALADADQNTLRISIDTNAAVHVGE